MANPPSGRSLRFSSGIRFVFSSFWKMKAMNCKCSLRHTRILLLSLIDDNTLYTVFRILCHLPFFLYGKVRWILLFTRTDCIRIFDCSEEQENKGKLVKKIYNEMYLLENVEILNSFELQRELTIELNYTDRYSNRAVSM